MDLHQDIGVWIVVKCHHHTRKLPRRWSPMAFGDTVHLSRSITSYDIYHYFREVGLNRLKIYPSRGYVTRNHEGTHDWVGSLSCQPQTLEVKSTKGFRQDLDAFRLTLGIHTDIVPWLLRCLKSPGVNVFTRSILEHAKDWIASVLTALETQAGTSFEALIRLEVFMPASHVMLSLIKIGMLE